MSDIDTVVQSLHPLERAVLAHLKGKMSVAELVNVSGLQEVEVLRGLGWLDGKKAVTRESSSQEFIGLDTNGLKYAQSELPERTLLNAIHKKSMELGKLKASCGLQPDEFSAALGVLRLGGLIQIGKEKVTLTERGSESLGKKFPEEQFLSHKFPVAVASLSHQDNDVFVRLKGRRQMVKIVVDKSTSASLTDVGKKLAQASGKLGEVIDHVTPQLLASGSWRGKSFRRFDVAASVPRMSGGRPHIVSETMEYVKSIWLEMGFKEISGNLVQTAFWNLDALFTPQDHPAREMADTFFLSGEGKVPALVKKVKQAHEGGVDGSGGYGGVWVEEKAKKVLLRTHTTVLSAQTLAALKSSDLPAKFFAVGRVFRNETLDWKHLFEFHQVEGIVIDPDANVRHLIGYLRQFYRKMGFPDVRVRPSFFPYTEPSLEVDVWHPGRKEWVEVGGAGIFRPEVVVPLLGKDIPVLAWGQGLERVLTEYYKLTDLRQIYRNDVNDLRSMRVMVR